MEPAGDRVQADAVRSVDPRRGVRLPVLESDLAGQQQFPAADHLLTAGEPLRVVGVVSAPAGVHAPDFAAGEVEAWGADMKQRRRVRAGPALAALAQMNAHGEIAPLRRPLLAPPAGQVHDLAGHGGHRQRKHQVVQLVGLAPVGQHRPGPDQAAGGEFDSHRDRQPRDVVDRVHLDLRPGVTPTLEELDRLLGLGATRIGEGSQGPHAWVVLTDPEGNELCLPVPPGS